jgi:hypothetical protein
MSRQSLKQGEKPTCVNLTLPYPLYYPTGYRSGYCLIKPSTWDLIGSSGSFYPFEIKHNYFVNYKGNLKTWKKRSNSYGKTETKSYLIEKEVSCRNTLWEITPMQL